MTVEALGLSYDPAHHRLSAVRGTLELEPHVGRVLARLMEDVDKPVGRPALMAALVGDVAGAGPALPLDDLFRRAMKDVRAAVRLFRGQQISVASRDEAVFVLCLSRPGTPPALRPAKERAPHVNVSVRAKREMEAQRQASAAGRAQAAS